MSFIVVVVFSAEKKAPKKFKVKKDDPAKTNEEVFVDPELVKAAHQVAGEASRFQAWFF